MKKCFCPSKSASNLLNFYIMSNVYDFGDWQTLNLTIQ